MTLGQMEDLPEEIIADTARDVAPSALRCAVTGCCALAAAILLHQPWCLDHFLEQSYRALERFEPLRHQTRPHPEHHRGLRGESRRELCGELRQDDARAFLDECSLQALTIALRAEPLSNLERSRLLDVLLWAGELSEALRTRAAKFEPRGDNPQPGSAASHDSANAAS